jgi:hypothetical protein
MRCPITVEFFEGARILDRFYFPDLEREGSKMGYMPGRMSSHFAVSYTSAREASELP